MILTVEMDLSVPVTAVEPFIGDLTAYPRWMGLVHAVSPADEHGGHRVELRGKLGPFARSKMLRMVRVEDPECIRFERRELDGRGHGRWELRASLTPVGTDGDMLTHLSMTLRYEGRLWSAVVEKILSEEIEQAKERLSTLVGSTG
ncbi:MAG: SRPBCC family protein [Ilumatobacteraceae bacterium]